ncbi:MAG: hypothetical protein FJ379_05985 [Verrucomicrobia bacterium]|nr:hypothetical protein [Verrucomicrobiota bacterium]
MNLPPRRHGFLLGFLLGLLPWLLLGATNGPGRGSPESLFQLGNREVAAGNYTNGLASYSGVATAPRTSAALEYNRGVAWSRLGEEGRALAHWRMAERLDPRNPLVATALRRPGGGGSMPNEEGDLLRGTDRLTLDEWGILALIPTWCWGSLLFLRRWKPAAAVALRGYTLGLGVISLVALGVLGVAVSRRSLGPDALTSNPQTPVRISPLDEARTAFELPAGTPLKTRSFREGWYLVADPRNERSGWVRAQHLTRLPLR